MTYIGVYEAAGLALIKESGVFVKKWRGSMSGRAWYKGKIIAAPYPKTAKSFEVLAHEIGHIVANPNRKAPSWEREMLASEYALVQFKRFGLKLPRQIKTKAARYIAYSVCQALNRGMKKIPAMVRKYCRGRVVKVRCVRPNGDFVKYAYRAI